MTTDQILNKILGEVTKLRKATEQSNALKKAELYLLDTDGVLNIDVKDVQGSTQEDQGMPD